MKSRRVVLAIALFCFLPPGVDAQVTPKATIKGRVLDDSTGAPLPLANVFVSNSSIGTAANAEGKFELHGVPVGTQQIFASIVGYLPSSFTANFTDSMVHIVTFRLKARPVQMPGVEVEEKDPVEWKANLARFVKAFFGSTPNASLCRILNPQVLDFSYEEDASRLVATAREPLEIENLALGYRFQCVIVLFTQSPQSFQYLGFTGFRPLVSQSAEEMDRWKANRRIAYYGSKRHFLQALMKKRIKEEGFEVNGVRREWLVSALLRPYGYSVDVNALLSAGDASYEKKMTFQDLLQVVYTRANRPQISLLEMNGLSVSIFSNGLTANPLGLYTYGFWSTQRGAEMLPLDYEPEQAP
jgi:hypothetical protein